jgi:hypothetical protein
MRATNLLFDTPQPDNTDGQTRSQPENVFSLDVTIYTLEGEKGGGEKGDAAPRSIFFL